MPKPIFVDVQFLQTNAYSRGMGRYFCELFYALLQRQTGTTYYCLYTSELPEDNIRDLQQQLESRGLASTVEFVVLRLQTNDFRLANFDAAYQQNLQICTDYVTEILGSEGSGTWLVPCLMQEPAVPVFPNLPRLSKSVIWYDLIPYLFYGHYFPDQNSAYARSYLKRLNALPKLDHVFSISAASKNDLEEFLSIVPSRITNIRGAMNQELARAGSGKLPKNVRTPFFLCPASPEPSKNVLNTIKGFGEFNAKHDNKYQLVITSNYDEKLAAEAQTYAQHVIFTGHVETAQLQTLYEQCQGLLFASAYEGLGLPVLEAVHFRKKVVCSDILVFRELEGKEAFYWCDPDSPTSIAHALQASLIGGAKLSANQQAVYQHIEQLYDWDKSAEQVAHVFAQLKPRAMPTRRVAVVGPHPASFSTIGKVIGESYPHFAEQVEMHYYYDSGPSDARHGLAHFHYLKEYEHLYPIGELPMRVDQYDKIIYHMGTSDHHMKTYLLAKACPATLVLHDTDLGGKGLSGQMLSNGFLTADRLQLELHVEAEFLKRPERFITSLVSSQQKIITHSNFASQVVHDYFLGKKENTIHAHLPIATTEILPRPQMDAPIQLGMVGILAGVKGLDSIEWLFRETDGLKGCELNVFGFGFFANKKRLADLQQSHLNLNVLFDLSDLDYKKQLARLDVLINYRTTYNGETSRSTLEAMRNQIIPVVRNIGWYSELPKDTCFALDDLSELPELVRDFGANPTKTRMRLVPMLSAGQKLLRAEYSFTNYIKILLED